MKKTITAAVLIPLLLLVGCSVNPINTLDLAIGAAEVVVPLVDPAAGVDPATTAVVSGYLAAVSSCTSQAADILAGSTSDAAKAAAISGACAAAVEPVIPAKYQVLAQAIGALSKYLSQFLAQATITPQDQHAIHVPNASSKARLVSLRGRALAARAH